MATHTQYLIMYKINLVLLLLLLIFYNILLSYSLVLIRTITATGIPVRRNRDLWNLNIRKLIYIDLIYIMSRNCFLQLEASLHVSDPDIKEDMFSKLESVNLMLLDTCKVF